MIGLGIVLAHFIGDYLLQTDWMATQKTRRLWPAYVHGWLYALPYLVLILMITGWDTPIVSGGFLAWLIIFVTHVIIDRYRLAKYFIWALNQLGPRAFRYSWSTAKHNSGYSAAKPVWLSTWLMFIVDNTLHLLINTAAIYLLVLQ